MQALNEGTIGAVRARDKVRRCVYQGQSGKTSWKEKTCGLTKVSCRSLMSARMEGLRWKIPACTGAGY